MTTAQARELVRMLEDLIEAKINEANPSQNILGVTSNQVRHFKDELTRAFTNWIGEP